MKRAFWVISILSFLFTCLLPFSAGAEQAFDCAAGLHKYALISQTPADEQTDGLEVYRCELCGQEYEAVLPATGHIWSEWSTDQAPTCTEPGLQHRTCSAHKPHDETKELPALGHDYVLTETPPTCDADGIKTYVCSLCGDSYTEPGAAALGHDYVGSITQEPSCTGGGVKSYVCSHDHTHSYTEAVPATGHQFGAWKVENQAKEGETGAEVRVCKNCAEQERRELPALPPEEPLFNALDITLASLDFLLILFAVLTLYPTLAGVHRVKKLWKQYLASKKPRS